MKKIIAISIFFFTLGSYLAESQTIVSTRHNLSISGTGAVKATSESEICIFCHTPHNSQPYGPLWNRSNPGLSYALYSSSTMQAVPGQPDGTSILCLSCHDGTIALGSVVSRSTAIAMNTLTMPRGNLTTDLSNDHPISFVYNASVASSDGQLKFPPQSPIALESTKLQCTSCHDPHKNVYTKFLVASNDASELCFKCHDRTYWSATSHNTSANTWNGSGTSPWAHIEFPFPNVSRNACENCHDPHNAGRPKLLLKAATEEGNCLDCHSGTVASSSKNIATQLAKTYRHDVASYINIHDPLEDNFIVTKHVECVDCHNPHASNAISATAPNVNGSVLGVSGINQAGSSVTTASFEYEICYKCHAGNTWSPPAASERLSPQNNVRLEFATTNPSYHPIVGARNNTDITSNLIAPNTSSTILYCSSCHSSDGGGAAGPHGSTYPQILKLQYSKANNTSESTSAYALCYSCHNRDNIINDINSFPYHRKHIVDKRIPCNACHDPHGVEGTSTNNSNLINFYTGFGGANPSGGIIRFIDTGTRSGSCQLTCHGANHNPFTYP